MKDFNRVFTFGCSFTSFNWPTWADLLIETSEKEGYNFGTSGAGNLYIQQRFWEAEKKYNINEDDLVVIMWTTPLREDRWLGADWSRYGNLFTTEFWPEVFKRDLVNEYHYYMLTFSLIYQTKKYLESKNIKHGFYFINDLQVEEYSHLVGINPESFIALKNFWGLDVNKNPSMMQYFNLVVQEKKSNIHTRPKIKYSNRNDILNEHHPTVAEHFKYLKSIIAEDLKLTLNYPKVQYLLDRYDYLENRENVIVFPEDDYYKFDETNKVKIKKDYHHIADFYYDVIKQYIKK